MSVCTRHTLFSTVSHIHPQTRIANLRPCIRTAGMTSKTDWNASQYLKFGDERTIPVRDLLSKVPLVSPKVIIDLGCGPGNSTAVLAERYPDANITGFDTSPDMLAKAKKALPNVNFEQADVITYKPDNSADLLFSNAVFQWLAPDQRISTMVRLLRNAASGSVLALQVPDNRYEPSHESMRQAARMEQTEVGLDDSNALNFALPSPEELYNALTPLCTKLDIWRTVYGHVLPNHEAVIEWVKATGLKPFIDPLSDAKREAYLKRYLDLIRQYYEPLSDGKVMLRYPRLFMVAVKA